MHDDLCTYLHSMLEKYQENQCNGCQEEVNFVRK